ncbi:unnamed protein product, partial [Closterium sp. NIES-54]
LGASASVAPGTGESAAPSAVSLADPSRGPVLAHSSTVLPCPAAPSGLLSGLHLPSFSTNLVSGADLQDAWVHQFAPRGQRVTHCTCSPTVRHLATFTRQPRSSLYTLTTASPPVSASGQVAASSQVFAAASRSSPASAPCSCRPLSHETLLWHHRLGNPSLPRLRGMASRTLVSGLPRSLPPLPSGPAPTCVPCVKGRQRAAPHSSTFPPKEAPLQTLHMDVWGPARVRGQGHKCYFLLVVDDYSRYTTVFPLRSKGEVPEVLINWIRGARRQLSERFGSDLPVLRLHSDRGGDFSSDLLRAFCRAEGIRQTFMLLASPQQNGIAERRIGIVMDVARASMIHAAAPHFLWPFAVQYAAHQINLQPRVSLRETTPTLRWTGKVGDASAFRVRGSRAFVRDTSADKLSYHAVTCVFLGFPPDAPGWQFYHPTSRRVLSSLDVMFDESVSYYCLFPYRTASLPPPPLFLAPGTPPVDPLPPQGPAPSGVSQVDPVKPVEVAVDSGAARGAEPAGAGTGGAEPGGIEPKRVESGGAKPERVEPGGAEPEHVESHAIPFSGPAPSGVSQVDPVKPVEVAVDSGAARGAEPAGAGTGGAEPGGIEPKRVESGGAKPERVEPGGAEPEHVESGGAEPGGTASGGAEPACAESGGSPGVPLRREPLSPQRLCEWCARRCRRATGATGTGGAACAGAAGGAAGAGAAGGAASAGGARTGGTGAAGTGGAAGIGAAGTDAGGVAGAVTGDPGAEGTGAVSAVSGGAALPRPFYVPLLQQVLGLPPSPGPTPPLLSPRPVQSQSQLQPSSPLPGPYPYSGPTRGLTERREPESRPVSPESRSASPVRTVCAGRRVSRPRPPPLPGTHSMTLRPSTAPQRVPLPSPFASSLPDGLDPESNSLRAASPTVTRFLATAVTDPLFESTAVSALVAELVEFAAACRLDYATSLVAESTSASVCPPSVGGECALGTDVLEDRREEFECFATAVPHLVSMLLALEGDPDALDIPTPRSYAEAIEGPYSSQWQAAMDAEMASWKSTGTYIDEVPPPRANISFPAGTQWSLRQLVYGLRQATREWHDTLRTTLATLGFAPSTANPSLFLRTDTTLPLFYVLVYVDDLAFATADTEALAHVKFELQKRHTCTDLGELTSYLDLRITRDRAQRTITLTQSHMVHQVLQRFGFTYSSPQSTPLPTGHSLSAPPSDESVEPSGPYPELVGCLMYPMTCTRPDLAYPLSLLARYVAPGRHRKVHWDVAKRVLRYLCSTSGMGLVLGGRARVVLTGHADASWELRWLTYLLTDLGEAPRSPPVLYVDNKAMLALCQEHRLEHKTKHIALCYFLARELQQRGQLRLAYVASQANTADVFTKALQPCDHQRFCTVLGLVPTVPHLLTS